MKAEQGGARGDFVRVSRIICENFIFEIFVFVAIGCCAFLAAIDRE